MARRLFEEAQRNQRGQAPHKSPSVSFVIRCRPTASESALREFISRRVAGHSLFPARHTSREQSAISQARCRLGLTKIVAFRLDFLLERAKKF
jgi:hypothetical protein